MSRKSRGSSRRTSAEMLAEDGEERFPLKRRLNYWQVRRYMNHEQVLPGPVITRIGLFSDALTAQNLSGVSRRYRDAMTGGGYYVGLLARPPAAGEDPQQVFNQHPERRLRSVTIDAAGKQLVANWVVRCLQQTFPDETFAGSMRGFLQIVYRQHDWPAIRLFMQRIIALKFSLEGQDYNFVIRRDYPMGSITSRLWLYDQLEPLALCLQPQLASLIARGEVPIHVVMAQTAQNINACLSALRHPRVKPWVQAGVLTAFEIFQNGTRWAYDVVKHFKVKAVGDAAKRNDQIAALCKQHLHDLLAVKKVVSVMNKPRVAYWLARHAFDIDDIHEKGSAWAIDSAQRLDEIEQLPRASEYFKAGYIKPRHMKEDTIDEAQELLSNLASRLIQSPPAQSVSLEAWTRQHLASLVPGLKPDEPIVGFCNVLEGIDGWPRRISLMNRLIAALWRTNCLGRRLTGTPDDFMQRMAMLFDDWGVELNLSARVGLYAICRMTNDNVAKLKRMLALPIVVKWLDQGVGSMFDIDHSTQSQLDVVVACITAVPALRDLPLIDWDNDLIEEEDSDADEFESDESCDGEDDAVIINRGIEAIRSSLDMLQDPAVDKLIDQYAFKAEMVLNMSEEEIGALLVDVESIANLSDVKYWLDRLQPEIFSVSHIARWSRESTLGLVSKLRAIDNMPIMPAEPHPDPEAGRGFEP